VDFVRVERVVRYRLTAIVVNNRSHYPTLLDAILFWISRHWWIFDVIIDCLEVIDRWKLLRCLEYFDIDECL